MAVEVITTILIAPTAAPPAGPYDLTDLATVKDELSIPDADTSNDAFLQRSISQCSSAIRNYCNRTFQNQAVQDQIFIQQDPYPWQVPGGVYPLQLSQWPLFDSPVVKVTGNTHGTTTIDGIGSTEGLTEGALVFAFDGSIPPATVIDTVSANSIVLSNPTTSTETGIAINTGLQVIQSYGIGQSQTLVYGRDFTIDAKKGWLIRLNNFTAVSTLWEAVPTTVQYQGGFATIPDDLVDAALRFITMRFKARGRDPLLVETTQGPSLGTQRWWVGPNVNQKGGLPTEIELIVDNYRVPVNA